MALSKFGFIVTGPGLDPELHRSSLKSAEFEMITLGVSDPAQGPEAALVLLREGVQLIELCGGFGARFTTAVLDAVAGRVPVGMVGYGPDAISSMHRLLGS